MAAIGMVWGTGTWTDDIWGDGTWGGAVVEVAASARVVYAYLPRAPIRPHRPKVRPKPKRDDEELIRLLAEYL